MGSDCPTSISFIGTEKLVCGLTSQNKLNVFDLEKGCKAYDLNFQGKEVCSQTNKVLHWGHRKMVVSAHEDRVIRFFDINSGTVDLKIGKCVKSLVAHSDAVTSVCFKRT